MNNVYTCMQEPQICSSALRLQPVFHFLLEALKRGWNLDHLDIPVAWMFSLQRTSIHCSSLTKYFSHSPLLSTRSDAVSAAFWPLLMWNWETRFSQMQSHDFAFYCGQFWCHGLENSGKQAAWAKYSSVRLTQSHNHFLFHFMLRWRVLK